MDIISKALFGKPRKCAKCSKIMKPVYGMFYPTKIIYDVVEAACPNCGALFCYFCALGRGTFEGPMTSCPRCGYNKLLQISDEQLDNLEYSNWRPSCIIHKFTDNGNGTVTDDLTELIWQKEDDGVQRNYHDAQHYCKRLKLGRMKNWRLPTVQELKSIVIKGAPANMDAAFSNAKPEPYWTITEFDYMLDGINQKETTAYTLDFCGGNETTYFKTNQYFVRAVSGKPAK